MATGFPPLSSDIASFALSALILTAYHLYMGLRAWRDPNHTVQAVNRQARRAWVQGVITHNRDILAVQTLRNSMMAAIFLASTSVLLIIGVLTLSGQGDKLGSAWHALNIIGATSTELWQTKLILLLFDLLVAFFSFAMAIRLFNHVGYLINAAADGAGFRANPEFVAIHLNRAGDYYSIGMRAYYFTVPLMFWLFGPHFLLAATVGLVVLLYRTDRAPRA
ncbi:MAG: DUF599 domain-containing protein [Pseudomonadota bacterium]|jgi:uncharacterized membrane protein